MPELHDGAALPAPGERAGGTLYQYRFGAAQFDEAKLQLTVAGQPLTVEPRPLRVLAELLHHANEVVTKEELFESVWEGRVTVDNVLANAVTKLRKALGDETGGRIVNVPRVGYRLAGPVERIALDVKADDLPVLQQGAPVPGRPSFQLVRPLGSGGQGRVWLARHPKTGQERVFKFARDGQQLGGLKREFTLARVLRAQLGARADLAAVHEAHFAEPPFSLECEYVGPDLLAWEEQTHSLAAMGPTQRIALFAQVAATVSAAHGLGVLHKDIKPANILVRGSVEPVSLALVDFGSGAIADVDHVRQWGITAMGLTLQDLGPDSAAAGTLMYVAPEVLAGQAGTVQSDVYALGVLLYQMVTAQLSKSLSTGWEREVDDALLREDIAAATDGDLGRRIRSVAELLQRVTTLEARRAQRAAQHTEQQRMAALTRELQLRRARRPWIVLSLMLLLAGLVLSAWMGWQAREALGLAQSSATRAEKINAFLTQDVLRAADPTTTGSGRQATVEAVIRSASRKASERFRDAPLVEAEIRDSLGAVYANLAIADAALDEYRKSLALRESVLPGGAAPVLRTRLALANVMAGDSRVDEAQAELLRVESLATPEVLAADADLAIELTEVRMSLASIQLKHEDALVHARRLMQLVDALPDPTAAHNMSRRAAARGQLAGVLYVMNQLDEAEALYRELLRPPFANTESSTPQALRRRARLAIVRLALGKTEGLEAEFIDVRDRLQSSLGPNDPTLAELVMSMGDFYVAAGRPEDAVRSFQDAHQRYRAGIPGHPNVIISKVNIGIAQIDAGHPRAGLDGLIDGRSAFVAKIGGVDNPVVQAIDFHRARALIDLGRAQEAMPLLDGLKPQLLSQAEPGVPWEARLQAERGRALIASGQSSKGSALLRGALDQMTASKANPAMLERYRKWL